MSTTKTKKEQDIKIEEKKPLSKTKKIIVSITLVAILVIGIIVGVILATIKRFDITADYEFDYLNHTYMMKVGRDNDHNISGTDIPGDIIYNNGTQIVKDSDGNKGIYSYIENKMIIDSTYDSITVLKDNTEDNQSYFLLKNHDTKNTQKVINQNGEVLPIITDNTTTIKVKNVSVKEKNGNVTTKIKNKFVNKEIKFTNIKFHKSYYKEDSYHYETWTFTSEDNISYTNLYKVNGSDRELVQTINSIVGTSIGNYYSLYILKNGTPILGREEVIELLDGSYNYKITIYDINFNEKRSSTISSSVLTNANATFTVGNSQIIQTTEPATEKDYDYYKITGTTTNYYKLTTYKLNYKTGTLKEINFKYLILSSDDSFNPETTLLSVQKIKDKSLNDTENILINERLQIKEIDYTFDTITKINKNRYLTSLDDDNFHLIDKNYNLIKNLSDYTNVFATKNSLIVQESGISGYTYICDFDGVVIKTYSNSLIKITYAEEGYCVKDTTTDGSITTDKYYLEELSYRKGELYSTSSTNNNIFGNNSVNYLDIDTYMNENYCLIVAIKEDGSKYDYLFYNINGKLLNTVEDVTSSTRSITFEQSFNDHVLVNFNGDTYCLDK